MVAEMTRLAIPLVLLVAGLAATAVVAKAACNPHPMESIELHPEHTSNPPLGPDHCELRADSATTATLRCDGSPQRAYHLTWVRP
jgi:hypothetical protein